MTRPTEAEEQTALFHWTALRTSKHPELALLFAIPNGGSRHPAEAANLKRQGVKAGVSDLFLPVARHGYHGLFIEMKRADGKPSDLSKAQKSWLIAVAKQGYKAVCCFGWEDAQEVIEKYLGG